MDVLIMDYECTHKESMTTKEEQFARSRLKIVFDLVQSEYRFYADITAFEQAIIAESSGRIDKKILLSGLGHVRDLSSKLLQAFRSEAEDSNFICFGSIFLRFVPDFQRVYCMYWECSETAMSYLEQCNQDPTMQPILASCFRAMQSNACSCLDIYSAIGRPIQRILKYPLFLAELLKCTDITHPHHSKLIDAAKHMNSLTVRINELKRQKDLVIKYGKHSDQSIGNRLSKLNLHSMKKKTSRLGYRLSTTLGITQLECDQIFESAKREFRSIEKLCRTLLRDLQFRCNRLQHIAEQQMSLCNSWRELIGANRLLFGYYSAWKHCIDVILPEFFATIRLRTIEPIEKALHLFDQPNKLIAKRFDKLIDCASIKTTAKTTLTESVRIKRGEYEALNDQLKSELPVLVTICENIYNSALRVLQSALHNFYVDIISNFSDLAKDQTQVVGIQQRFIVSFQLAFNELKSVAASVATTISMNLSRVDNIHFCPDGS